MSKTIVRRTLRGFAVRDRIEQKILPFEAELAKAARSRALRAETSAAPPTAHQTVDGRVPTTEKFC